MPRRKWLVILMAGLAPLAIRALLLPFLPAPAPRVQDEFSHLLVADTFAHGRLVNPAHPMWVHFESMHVLVRPVYASVFPIAQGIAMAIGQVVFGHPWAGVWLGIALMCASLSWMLYCWVPPRWALLGSAIVVVRFGVLSYWMNSYYGGALAAAGGALVLGALKTRVGVLAESSMHRKLGSDISFGAFCRNWLSDLGLPCRVHVSEVGTRLQRSGSVLLALGLAILANTRPYEGALLAVPVLLALVWTLRDRIRHFALPAILILGATAAAMSYYCARVTGNPLQLPYAFYRATYTQAPHFVFQQPRPEPVYHHRVLHDFQAIWEMSCYHDARANRAPHGLLDKALSYWRFYLGPVLTLPFLTLPWMWRRRRIRLLLLLAAAFAAGLAVEVWNAPHYAAPATGLAILLTIEALRHVRAIAGPWPVRVLVLACLLTPIVGGSGTASDGRPRARILDQLQSAGGRHLVLVRYTRSHDVGDEWVYNAADIDNSPVVWAREMDPTSNQELLRYFNGRRAWLLQPDQSPPVLTPYDPANAPDPPLRFVRLGDPAITALRSPDDLRRKIAGDPRSCDLWNYAFTQSTGVEAPDPAQGCFPPNHRADPVSFDQWFAWLEKQR